MGKPTKIRSLAADETRLVAQALTELADSLTEGVTTGSDIADRVLSETRETAARLADEFGSAERVQVTRPGPARERKSSG